MEVSVALLTTWFKWLWVLLLFPPDTGQGTGQHAQVWQCWLHTPFTWAFVLAVLAVPGSLDDCHSMSFSSWIAVPALLWITPSHFLSCPINAVCKHVITGL